MARNDHRLSNRELLASLGVILALLVAGVILFAVGLNEGFHSDDGRVRAVFEALTELGSDKLYLVVISLAYLSYDKRFGRRLCYVFFMVVYATDFLKEFFHDPRPPANLERDSPVSGYGFPSGHTTTSVTFYGYIMLSHLGDARARWPLAIVCGFAMVVVPVSRLVIGAHDVQDVVGGAVVSLAILAAYMVLWPRVSQAASSWPTCRRVGLGLVGALLLWLVGGLVLAVRHPWDLGVALEETAMGAGLLLGCAVAFPLEEAYVDHRPELMTPWQRVLSAIVGLPVTIGTFAAMVVAGEMFLPSVLADVATYLVMMLVLALLVPWALRRFVLKQGRDEAEDPRGPGI